MELSFFQTFHSILSVTYGHGYIGVGPEEVMKTIRVLPSWRQAKSIGVAQPPREEKVPERP